MNTKQLEKQLEDFRKQFLRIKAILFIVVVLVMYIYVMWRVNVLSNAQPSTQAVAAHQTIETLPSIDQATITKIQQLQDNSVSVQGLFNEARQNPFQE